VQSILPADTFQVSNTQILRINQKLKAIAQQENVTYLDLFPHFADHQARLRQDLSTDGIHLNPRGYATWQWALGQMDNLLASSRI
jgi:lysophospholipase L1-like esterase